MALCHLNILCSHCNPRWILAADSGVGSSQDATALSSNYTSATQSKVEGKARYAADGTMLATDRSPSPSPFSQQSKPTSHSRHVSWDDTHPEAAATGGLQDSGEPFVNFFLCNSDACMCPASCWQRVHVSVQCSYICRCDLLLSAIGMAQLGVCSCFAVSDLMFA